MPEARIASLSQSLADLIAESQALRTDVNAAEVAREHEAKQRKRENQINLGLIGMIAIFVVMVMVMVWQNNSISQDTRQTNKQMADCTTPGGGCYEEGRARTADAISDITKVSIYMAECSRLSPGESGPEFDKKLEACVYEKLKAGR